MVDGEVTEIGCSDNAGHYDAVLGSALDRGNSSQMRLDLREK